MFDDVPLVFKLDAGHKRDLRKIFEMVGVLWFEVRVVRKYFIVVHDRNQGVMLYSRRKRRSGNEKECSMRRGGIFGSSFEWRRWSVGCKRSREELRWLLANTCVHWVERGGLELCS